MPPRALPRRHLLGAACAAALLGSAARAADLPALIAASKASVLPVGTYSEIGRAHV